MKKSLALALLFLSSLSAHAANWVLTGQDEILSHHIDHDSIQIHHFTDGGTYLSAWTRYDFHQAQDVGDGKSYWQTKSLNYYDCSARSITYDHAIAYGKEGNQVHRSEQDVSTHSSQTWDKVAPNSMGEMLLDHACSQLKR